MIEVRNLTKTYVSGIIRKKVTQALVDINLSVPKGAVFGLTGESGCGKTTFAMLALRLLAPTSGTVHIDGREITGMKRAQFRKLRPDCQIIWQNPDASLSPRMRLADSILEPLRYHRKCGRKEESRILAECCRRVELPESLLGRYPHEVSGGENQRAVIARMLTLRPRLLIADEPTSSLDVLVQAQILDLLKRIQSRLGMTLLFISHDLRAVRYMCEHVAIMHQGRIVETGRCEDVLSAPRSAYCRELVKNAFSPWKFTA